MHTRLNYSSKDLIKFIIEGIQNKKGKNIVNISFKKIENAVCQNFIICNGDSNTHVCAIGDSVEDYVKNKLNERADHKEGFKNAQWILLDYIDVVVHVFQKQYRDHYKLEELWADADITVIEEKITENNRIINYD